MAVRCYSLWSPFSPVRAVLRLQELMRPYAVTSPTHLSGLDSLRWYSALAVIITHVELHKRYHGLANVWDSVWIQNLGPAGVYFFFALSGFLITWLLKKERANALSTVLPSFYRRRAWRILPLYYLLVVLGFLVLPQFSAFAYPEGMSAGPNASELVAFVSAQPHVASSFLQRVPNISHLWSIGVELTFYSFWPLMVLRSRNLNRSIVVFIAGILTVKASLLLLGPALFHDPQPFFGNVEVRMHGCRRLVRVTERPAYGIVAVAPKDGVVRTSRYSARFSFVRHPTGQCGSPAVVRSVWDYRERCRIQSGTAGSLS